MENAWVLCTFLCIVQGQYYGRFPDNFTWGVATSAYQIEGAWNRDGKSVHIWDTFVHAGKAYHGDTGNDACKSYDLYKEDVKILKSIGVNHYRFSLAWTRIVPNPLTGVVNMKGIDYYNRLINELLRENITPLVTLFHWDLPQVLEDHGSWSNDAIIELFNFYADTAFKHFGDRVKHWITFNEPWVICWMGYGTGEYAPGRKEPADTPYRCAHNIIRSHVRTYHTYQNKYKQAQTGEVGITCNTEFMEPLNESSLADQIAAHRRQQFQLGWFLNPIFGNGDYPDVMKDYVGRKSVAEGRQVSRLPKFTPAERAQNAGEVGITLNTDYLSPKNESSLADQVAAHRAQQFSLGWFASPLFGNGDYPDVMKDYIGRKSFAEGRHASRLPTFTPAERAQNAGAADFFGLNHYTTNLISPASSGTSYTPGWTGDQDTSVSHDPNWPTSGSYWLYVVPWGFRKLLNWIKDEYNNPRVIITENGVTDNNGTLEDTHRVTYYKGYITEMLKAINEDGCNVFGYTAWSIMDNFEWSNGYHEKFGLHYIDFSDPNRTRIPKQSARAYKEIIANNGFMPPLVVVG